MEIVLILLPIMGIVLRVLGQPFSKIAKAYLYFSFFCVAVVASTTFFPFIGGKDYFFRVVIEMALAAALLWWAFEAKPKELSSRIKKIVRQPLFIAVSFLTLAVLLSSVFAYDPHAAFWSNYERGEGGFQFLHYYAFFTLLLIFFDRKEDWELAIKASLVAASLMIAYGIAVLLDLSGFIGPGLCERFQGSLGNPAYVAPYLMFAMFYAAYLWFNRPKQEVHTRGLVRSAAISLVLLGILIVLNSSFLPPSIAGAVKPYTAYATAHPSFNLILTILIYLLFPALYGLHLVRKNVKSSDFLQQMLYAALFAMFLFFFLLTQTRGAFLGIGAGILAGLVYALFLKFPRKTKYGVAVAFIVLLSVGGVAYMYRQHNIPLVPFCASSSRLVDLSIEESTAQTRFWTWGSAVQGWKERPVFGWGFENFSVVFDKYFNERHFSPNVATETWFDRAHSVIFDYLAETGALGLLAYLAVLLVFVVQLFWHKKNREIHAGGANEKSHRDAAELPPILRVCFFAIITGYFVQALVLFDVLPIYLNLFFVLALGAYYFAPQKTSSQPTQHHERHT